MNAYSCTFVEIIATVGLLPFVLSAQEPGPIRAEQSGRITREETAVQERVAELIDVLADPHARDLNLERTGETIAELVKIGAPAVPQLVRAIVDDRPNQGPYSALALDRIGAAAVGEVRKQFDTLNDFKRWKLMRFRGKCDYDASLEYAITSLDSKEIDVRTFAVRYAGQYKEEKARDYLLRMLNTDTPRLRWEIVDALAEIGGDEAIDALIKLLAPDSWAARGLGQHIDGERPPWWPDGRPAIIATLHKLKVERAAPTFLKVLAERGSGKGYLGLIIIPALADFQCKEATSELRRILATPTDALALARDGTVIKCYAASALWHLGDRVGRSLLIQCVFDSAPGTAQPCWEAISTLADKSDIWVLVHCLELPGTERRQRACKTLERITGITKRSPGWAVSTEHDAPLWKAWYHDHRGELPDMQFSSNSSTLRNVIKADAQPLVDIVSTPSVRANDLDLLWRSLDSADHSRAVDAMFKLLDSPGDALSLLDSAFPMNDAVDRSTVNQTIIRLGAEDFRSREAAEFELERMGWHVVPSLEAALTRPIDPEAERRVRRLLGHYTAPISMREVRAIAILEELDNCKARSILRRVARGNPASNLTLEATGALERLSASKPD